MNHPRTVLYLIREKSYIERDSYTSDPSYYSNVSTAIFFVYAKERWGNREYGISFSCYRVDYYGLRYEHFKYKQ